MVAFSRKVARDASSITFKDAEELRMHGFSDAEIFDITATSAARAFFTKLVEGLGVEPEPPFRAFEPEFIKAVALGRPIDFTVIWPTDSRRSTVAQNVSHGWL